MSIDGRHYWGGRYHNAAEYEDQCHFLREISQPRIRVSRMKNNIKYFMKKQGITLENVDSCTFYDINYRGVEKKAGSTMNPAMININ